MTGSLGLGGYGARQGLIQSPAIKPLQILPNTVGMWTFNDTLNDLGPNALNLTMAAGSAAYTNVDTGLRGFDGNGGRSMLAPNSSLLRLTGEMTLEFLFVGGANVTTFVQCENATGTSILYAFYADSSTLRYADNNVNNAVASVSPPAGRASYLVGVRRNTGGSNYEVSYYLNGAQLAGTLATLSPGSDGTEQMRIAGFIGGPNWNADFACVTISSVARTATEIKNQYNWSLGNRYGFV